VRICARVRAREAAVCALWKVPETREKENHGPLDWPGAALATIGLGGVIYGLIESPRLGFSNPLVLLTLIGGLVALAVFIINEARAKNPMVPLKLFRNLIDRSSDAIEVIDPTTLRLLDCNQSAYQTLGYSREEFLSLTLFDIDPLVDQSLLAWIDEEMESLCNALVDARSRRRLTVA